MPEMLKRPLKRIARKALLPEGRRHAAMRLPDLFHQLKERGSSYVVIRWFDDLPFRADGDIDFVVADDSLADFEALLNRNREGIPCDVYSESALRGYRYGDVAYYPPELARRILDRRVYRDGSVSVPCAEDHFFSLAYHCLYHKGTDCGLPTSNRGVRPAAVPKHDYRGTLAALAAEVRLKVNLDMESLDELLEARGWRPDREMLERLMVDNLWLCLRDDPERALEARGHG